VVDTGPWHGLGSVVLGGDHMGLDFSFSCSRGRISEEIDGQYSNTEGYVLETTKGLPLLVENS
jgi:hypothetical protein